MLFSKLRSLAYLLTCFKASCNAFVVPIIATSRFSASTSTSPSPPQSSSSTALLAAQPVELEERFDRWRYLQRLLDEMTDPEQTNQLLFEVLDGYLKYPRGKFGETDATGSPERTTSRMEKVTQVVVEHEKSGTIPLTSNPQQNVSHLLVQLEELLPDPVEEEDEHKGTWDTVLELHGRDAVKYGQQNPTMEWQARCLAARLLIFYDFMELGVVDKPIMDVVASDDLKP